MNTAGSHRAVTLRPDSFARKGEARPLGRGRDDHAGDRDPGAPVAMASVLSGLIRRKVSPPAGTPIRFEPAAAPTPTPTPMPMPVPEPYRSAATKPTAVCKRSRRRRVTVRLTTADFEAIDRLKRTTGMTYQSLVERAVRSRYRDPD